MFGIVMGGKSRRRRGGCSLVSTPVSAPSSGRATRTNWLLRLFFRVTGGRPMRLECSAFWDGVSQKPVFYFRDRLRNVRYMANSKWSLFRVEAKSQG